MDVFLLSVISAFLLFALILPLFGIAIGLFCYYVLPYVFGGLLTFTLLFITGVNLLFALWTWLVTLLWASAVLFVKMRFRKLGEEIEHYRAAHAILLCGIPYRRKRDAMREALIVSGEV